MRKIRFVLGTLCLPMVFVLTEAHADVTLIVAPKSNSAKDLQSILRSPEVISSEPVFAETERTFLSKKGLSGIANSQKLTVRSEKDARVLVTRTKQQGLSVTIEANHAIHPESSSIETEQWGIHNTGQSQPLDLDDLTSLQVPGKSGEDIGLPSDLFLAKNKLIVAVLDTGVDDTHPDLAPVLHRRASECEAQVRYQECLKKGDKSACNQLATVDTDGNGYPLDCLGWNVTTGHNSTTQLVGDPDVKDELGHGTHVAGIIQSVSPNVSILPVKVVSRNPNSPIRPQAAEAPRPAPVPQSVGFVDSVAHGMIYAIQSKARVINLSLAWPAGVDSPLMRQIVDLARDEKILVVAAAGNDSTEARVFPCAYTGVICVGAHGPDGALTHFSNYGSSVDVAAPGLRILSAWPLKKRPASYTEGEGFEFKNGTSMAAPFVSGALAELMTRGISPKDSFARLMIGARPVLPNPLRPTVLPEKTIRSGNADIRAALGAQPQPLILPESKALISIPWLGQASSIPLSLKLKNYWTDSIGSLRVTARLTNDGKSLTAAALGVSEWTIPSWEEDGVHEFRTSLEIKDPRSLSQDLTIELSVSTPGQSTRLVSIPVKITVPVHRNFSRPGATSLTYVGPVVGEDASLRSVSAPLESAGSASQEYFAIERLGPEWRLTLISPAEQGSAYHAAASATLPSVAGELLLIHRLKDEYVLIFRITPPQGKSRPVFRFQFLDRKLKSLRAMDFDNQASVIDERFQWLRIEQNGTKFWVPAWIGWGSVPASEKEPYDPWNPNPDEEYSWRFYYLAPTGTLHTLKAPEGYSFLQLQVPSEAQRASGQIPVLLAKGENYEVDYATALIAALEVQELKPLELDVYRAFAGLNNILPVRSLKTGSIGDRILGTAFSGPGVRGSQRTTLLLQRDGETQIVDSTQSPGSMTDSVTKILGAFSGSARTAVFSESHYELQYQDLSSGEISFTSLRRFSFLPGFIFSSTFFPITIQDSTASVGEALPGILIPSGLGASLGMEVIVPRYDSSGRLVELIRPAGLHLEETAECREIANPLEGSPTHASQIVFFCGDRFVRIPLIF